jgi:hypothetical protein
MLFEEHPLVLLVVIVLTVEGWNIAKTVIRAAWQRRRAQARLP